MSEHGIVYDLASGARLESVSRHVTSNKTNLKPWPFLGLFILVINSNIEEIRESLQTLELTEKQI